MSAYIVDKNHILFLLESAQSRAIRQNYGDLKWYWGVNGWHQIESGNPEQIAEVGNMLWRENMKSVGHRYQHESSATLPGPNDRSSVISPQDLRIWTHIDPVQVLKACDCYAYQTCEHPEWKESEAFAFIEALRHSAWVSLPGYDKATWGAPEPMAGQMVSLSSLCRK